MVLTVAVVAPSVSITRSYMKHNRQAHKFFLLQGATYQDAFACKDELEGIAGIYPPSVMCLVTVRRPAGKRSDNRDGATGWVNSIAQE